MALVTASLAADLKDIFDAMDKDPKDNKWLADQMAAAFDKQMKTAGIPLGSVIVAVAGQAVGTPNPAEIMVG